MENVASGKILIAEPFMEDPYFKGAVVFLCECKNENAFGLILNKPTEMKVHEVVEDFPVVENHIFYGVGTAEYPALSSQTWRPFNRQHEGSGWNILGR